MKHIRPTFLACMLTSAIGLVAASSSASAASNEVQALKSQIQVLMNKVEKLEANSAPSASGSKEGEVVTAGSLPGSFKIPGTNTSLKFGGYAKLDAIYDFSSARSGSGKEYGLFASVPLDGSSEANKDGQVNFHARQSRLNLTTVTPTAYGELKVFVEGDFFGTAGNETTTNASGFVMRHAYGSLGPVLAGQTFSNYMDLDAYPETMDYVGPAGITLIRQGQIRYTHKFAEKDAFSIALENPEGDFSSDVTATTTNTSVVDQIPDVTAKVVFSRPWGHVALKGIAREIQLENNVTGGEDSEFGYGIGVSGKFTGFLGKDDIRYQIATGDGLGRYVFDLAVGRQSAAFSAASRLETQRATAGYVAYRHVWNDQLRSNLMYGRTQVDNENFLPATVNEKVESYHANLLWSPVPQTTFGVEYIHGQRETEGGADGDLDRIQTSFIYNF